MEHANTKTESADEFARANLLYYSGDVDAIEHGGTFFNLNRDHHKNGYIEALRLCRCDDEPFSSVCLVESLTIIIDAPGSEHWNGCASCCGQSREEYDRADDKEKMIRDAECALAYGRYDPAEMGYEHHTLCILTDALDDDARGILDTGAMTPSAFPFTLDGDGDAVLLDAQFWSHVQTQADATFTGLTHWDNTMCPIDLGHLDKFTMAYLTCALWSSTGTIGEDGDTFPLDEKYGIGDIAESSMRQAIADCEKFQEENPIGDDDRVTGSAELLSDDEFAGHDFWLTRNGHGSGFWDDGRWLKAFGDKATKYCRAAGEVHADVGDDGEVYFIS